MVDQTRIRKKFQELWKDNVSYKGRLLLSSAVMLALSFTFLFFGPLEITAFSGKSLVFTYRDILPILLVMLAIGVAFAPLLALLRGRIFHYTVCVLVACTLFGYLQAMLLNGGLGLLTGDAISWNEYTGMAILGIVLWAALLIGFLLTMYLHRKFWWRMMCGISLLLVVMQLVPTISILCGAYDNAQPDSLSGYHLSEEGLAEYAAEENVFVFVLDRLDYDYIDRALKENPDFLDGLDGFTSYTNAISAYARTQPALAHLLTGVDDITYQVPESRFFTEVWNHKDTNILKTLQAADYSVNIYTNIRNLFGDRQVAETHVDNVSNGVSGMNYLTTAKKLLELSAFRYAPTALKPFFWADTNYYNTGIYHKDDFAAYQFDDVGYATRLQNATVGSAQNAFRMYHFFGPHSPYTMNADGTLSQTDTTVTDQLVGSFVNLTKIFNRMKELGIYENATILITGDHGAAMYDTKPLVKATRIGLFYKPAGSAGTPLQHSSAPVSVANIPATLAKSAGLDYTNLGTPLDEVAENADIVRYYFKTVCDEKTYRETQMCIYAVTGDASKFKNWELVDTVAIPYSYN